MTVQTISPRDLRLLLEGVDELVIVDVHEVEDFRTGHLYHAAYLPLSWREARADRVRALVPRLATTVVLTGPADEIDAEAERWVTWGYTGVVVLAGGTSAWVADGGQAYAHLCVPSKALAESARERFGTPSVTPEELARELRSDAPPLVVDVRTAAEHAAATIPGAVNIPGGELLAVIGHHRPDAEQAVVVTCGGRTRAVFGAQSLRDAGHPGIAFLEGGTTAWAESGRPLEQGAPAAPLATRTPDPSVIERLAPVTRVGTDTLRDLQADDRTTYLIDPRLEPGQVPLGGLEPRHVPAGQLVEAVDEYLPVLRARVVLVDDEPHVRAAAIARWLSAYRQLEVYVLDPRVIAPPRRVAPVVSRATTRPSAQLRALSTSGDQRAWSHALPALADAEPGGGFAW